MRKSSSEMLINPRVVFMFTRQRWSSIPPSVLGWLRLCEQMNIKYIFSPQLLFLLFPYTYLEKGILFDFRDKIKIVTTYKNFFSNHDFCL